MCAGYVAPEAVQALVGHENTRSEYRAGVRAVCKMAAARAPG